MDDDIVTRLRDITELDADAEEVTVPICDEAADEIERLRALGDTLARYMAMEHYPEDCEDECESLGAWRAWQEARRG